MSFRTIVVSGLCFVFVSSVADGAETLRRYAASDSHSGYVHWIDLYDATNVKINPSTENPKPYSPMQTCGRCHDVETISHGWHFNAVDATSTSGRTGQPWIWSDGRTGTHLPLSYRGWKGAFQPDALGISRWDMTAKFGGFLPGGGPGASESLALDSRVDKSEATQNGDKSAIDAININRANITGPLPVDCMICHRNQGSGYSPFVWTEQIEQQNFAYAPTAALGIGTVDGSLKRLKDDFDPKAEGSAEKLPRVVYETQRFRSDGKVFFDLVRKPTNDACYYCHTNIDAESVTGTRWLHDGDIHVRAGIECADCHRNGLDHHTVRGFEGEVHVAGNKIASLSCQGCHLGSSEATDSAFAAAGRLGAPTPGHHGIPPLHFEKLSCTACHSGPQPQLEVPKQLNSIVHRLGEHLRRTGMELPAIVGPVMLPMEGTGALSKYVPQRLTWPSYWGTISDAKVTPLHPEEAYQLLRKTLKVRGDFTEELSEVKLTSAQRSELLGPDRARTKPEELTPEEAAKVTAAESTARQSQVQEVVSESLAAIEQAYVNRKAVFISGGAGFVRSTEGAIEQVTADQIGDAAAPYSWPMAHQVRPAAQSWGITGCTECHTENSLFFNSVVRPVGLLPGQVTEPIIAHELQKADMVRLQNWNQMFAGRSIFKIAGLIALGMTVLLAISSFAWNLGGIWKRLGSRS